MIVEDYLPIALSIGVEYDVFWRLTPRLLHAFVDADRLRKREIELEMYVQGRYMFDAVSLALANGFRQKGSRVMNWLEEPYRIIPLTEAEKAAQAEEERRRAIEFFNAMIPKQEGGAEIG